MKKRIALLLALLMLGLCCAHAEELSGMTTEELIALRSAIDAELGARLESTITAAEQASTSPDQFICVDNGEVVMIRGYAGTEPDIVIPSEINGLPVTCIGESAFKENQVIRSVVIPDSVVEIGVSAFHNCKNLQSVVLSKNVTELRQYTFAYCSKLTTINLEHVSVYGSGAVMGCALSGVLVLQAKDLVIGGSAFRYINTLTGVKICAETCLINDAYAFAQMGGLRWICVSDGTQLTITNKIMSDCPSFETFVAPATTTVTYSKDDLFTNCPGLVICTPEGSGLHAYAKEYFLRCAPAQYEEMSALLNAAEQ